MKMLTETQQESLATFLKEFNYSGMTTKFSGNLARLSSFTGKEYGTLAQVMPLALLRLQCDPLMITAWSLVSEAFLSFLFSVFLSKAALFIFIQIFVDDYQWYQDRSTLEHKRRMVNIYFFFFFLLPFHSFIFLQRTLMLGVASDIFSDLLNKQKTHLEACHTVDSCRRFGPLVHLTTEVLSLHLSYPTPFFFFFFFFFFAEA